MTVTQAQDFPDLFQIAQQAFVRFRDEFRDYGLEIDPTMEVRRGNGLLCFYDFDDRQIYLSMPDFNAPLGKLQMLMFRQMLMAETNEELMRFLAIFIPFVVAHEMTHHLRHRTGLFGTDNWLEEHLANQMAAALNKHRIAPQERAFAVRFLQRAVHKLGEQLGIGQNAFDSYHDIAHALRASNQLSAGEMDNFKMVQGVAEFEVSATMALRESDMFNDAVNQRLEKRHELIANFNQQYAGDPVRYIYYQVGWLYLAMNSAEANYVDEFARVHLKRAPSYLTFTTPRAFLPRSIHACYKASLALRESSPTLGRYFYKRYRAHLLAYVKKQQSGEGGDGEGANPVNLDILAIWDDRTNDPLNFLAGMVPPPMREVFPNRIGSSTEQDSARLPADLPTPEDRLLWEQASSGPSTRRTAAQTTFRLLDQFDRLDLFRALPPEIILELGSKFYVVRYAAGETLVWQGETNSDVFVLLDGRLETLVEGSNKRGSISAGEVFGEIAWLTDGARAATVRAVGRAVCMVIKSSDLKILAFRNPSILLSIAANLATRFKSIL